MGIFYFFLLTNGKNLNAGKAGWGNDRNALNIPLALQHYLTPIHYLGNGGEGVPSNRFSNTGVPGPAIKPTQGQK